jgi:Flp pilus assembly protein TadD
MNPDSFETLLTQADAEARQGDWEATYAHLKRAAELEPQHPGALTGLGTCLIQLGRPVEAVPHFQQAVTLAPDSPEAHNNLGVAFALAEQLEAAAAAYERALALDANHAPAWKNLAMVYLRRDRLVEGVQILAAVVKAYPRDTEALFLLATCYEDGGDLASARALYQETLKFQPDHPQARQALARLPQPNADPVRIARPEHAHKLAALKGLRKAPEATRPGAQNGGAAARSGAALRVAFFGPPEPATEARLAAPAQTLGEGGFQVKVGTKFDPANLEEFNTFVFANPHRSTHLAAAIEQCALAGKRVVVDLDRDFLHPPSFQETGPGQPEALQALETALAKADLLTVPAQLLAERYAPLAKRVAVIPYSWNPKNLLWSKPAPRRQTVNIGLVGAHTHPKDLKVLQQDLVKLLRERPQALLAVGEDFSLYQSFASLSDARRLFIPAGRTEDYPYLLAHFDILLVPLYDDLFNQARSDLPLLGAGARGIPWVATPIAAFQAWGAGGLFAGQRGDWYTALKRLLDDAELRRDLGEAGRRKAAERESGQMLRLWQESLE